MTDVVIVTANSRAMVLRCLEHLPDGVNPIVVDNGSTDDTAEACTAAGATVVRLPEPSGLAYAFNRGAAAGAADRVLFLNDDILAMPGSVEALVEFLDGSDAVAVGGRLVDPDTLETQPRYLPARFPSALDLALTASGLGSLLRSAPPVEPTATGPVEQLAGACILVRRPVFERLGGWDERFFFWYEDVDFCRRLAGAGRIVFVPSARFRHEGGASFARWDRERSLRSMLHGTLQYAAAHFDAVRRAGVGGLVAALALPRIVVFAVLRQAPMARLYRDVAGAAWALARGRAVPPLMGPA
ncbi:MAG: hypothetical protein QOF76_4897 [Solirubrobacteraceae bacterium]|nr:hypothetical protein [Solirubrobacteraceae bacterium]